MSAGLRAVNTARRDYTTLTEAASLYSSHIYDVPQQVRKSLEETKAAGKAQHKLLEELAELYAERLLAQTTGSPQVIAQFFPDRDAAFIKLLAQKLTAGKSLSSLCSPPAQASRRWSLPRLRARNPIWAS